MPTLTAIEAVHAAKSIRSMLVQLGLQPGTALAPILAKLEGEAPPKGARVPKLPAVGTGAHTRCVHHEPIALAELTTRVLCFDAAPGKREIADRIAFATLIAKRIAAHRKAHEARPTGDGLIAMGDGKRLAPRKYLAWLASGKAPKELARTPHLTVNPKPSRKAPPASPFASRFTGKRGIHKARRKAKAAA